MPWVAITSNDVLALLNNSEASVYDNFRLASGQSDPMTTIIGHVTSEILGAVRRFHTLDAGGGIPDTCLGAAADMVAYRLILRAGATPSDGRKAAYEQAVEFFQKIYDGKIGVPMPANPTTEATSAPAPSIACPPHRHSWGCPDGRF